ncbi:MAG: ACT domain-containing protein [Eubacteriaceae bacterium]|jgi:aspartate kinase|nr:ACT domain-containing protein [Eubacteriaceae bacterium]
MNIVMKFSGAVIDTDQKIMDIASDIAERKICDFGLAALTASPDGGTGNEQAEVLADALRSKGIDAVFIKDADPSKIREAVLFKRIPVASASADPKLNADTFAVMTAAKLGWDCAFIRNGGAIRSADTKYYPEAKERRFLTYDEVMELSNLGDWVIEAKAVELAKKYHVRILAIAPMEKDRRKGTFIMNNTNLLVEDTPVTGISVQEDISVFTFKGIKNSTSAAAQCFGLLDDLKINVDMISQQIDDQGNCSISFSCTKAQGESLEKNMAGNAAFEGITVESRKDLSMISLVGAGMASYVGVAAKFFKVLDDEGIKFYNISTSEISIQITVANADKGKAVIALGRAFGI